MKEVLMVTTKYHNDVNNPWLTNDMANEFKHRDINVTVLALSWNDIDPDSSDEIENGIRVVRIKLNKFFYRKNKIFTLFKTGMFPMCAMLKLIFIRNSLRPQLVIFNTPCVTILGLSTLCKFLFSAKTTLVLWDFFPFYLKDLGLMNGNVKFQFFKWLENKMYNSFDSIGCMSEGNKKFLLENFSKIQPSRLYNLPIWARTRDNKLIKDKGILSKYGLNTELVTFIYGGAMSIVQNLDVLIELARRMSDCQFVFIGSGTEKSRLKLLSSSLCNVHFLSAIPRTEYESLVAGCDVGMVCLSPNLLVPSFPSKTLDYLRTATPILAALDRGTDYGFYLENVIQAGIFAYSDDISTLEAKARLLVSSTKMRTEMGTKGALFFDENFTVSSATDAILKVN